MCDCSSVVECSDGVRWSSRSVVWSERRPSVLSLRGSELVIMVGRSIRAWFFPSGASS